MILPPFSIDGLLPPGDYALTLDELLDSSLVMGSGETEGWNGAWRAKLVGGLKVLVGHPKGLSKSEVSHDPHRL